MPIIECFRSITFVIPGVDGAPDVQVTAVEVAGAIEFTVEVLTTGGATADLRGLFFDVADLGKLTGLTPAGADVNSFDTDDVINLGHGSNMHGAASPFDVGIEFGTPGKGKDDTQTTTFVLSNDAGDLTLDDIAQVEFGARLTSVGEAGGRRSDSAKLVTIAPAAPDAVDDSYDIFEDGQDGLDDPSSVSEGVLFEVLDNDTDADGDTLTITHVFGATHGTVTIVDGDDADLLPGDAVLYTPDTDYSGPDEFTYCITDNNGGTDFAHVDVVVAAVADIPDVSVEAFATDDVNVIRLVVTATQTDDDNSEFIDQILSSALPPGVTLSPAGTVNPGTQPLQLVQEYFLTLPLDQDTDFDLTFTAVSEELSNGDTETGSETIDIIYEFNSTLTALQFSADDQSIWSNGDEFVFDDDTFFGIDTGAFDEDLSFGPFVAGISGNIKLGFQSTLHFEGGSIDALADYDVTVETNYNKTVDELLIDTSALLTDASFFTEGPVGSYMLDFVWDILLDAYAGVDIDLGSIDLGVGTIDFGSITETINMPTIDIGPGSLNILDVTNEDIGGEIPFPPPVDAFSLEFDWPEITTTGVAPPLDPVSAMGSSENFLQLNLDVDDLLTTLLGLPVNPLHPLDIELGPFFADIDLLNIFVNAGLNFLQEFEMSMGELSGLLTFEDGSNSLFTIGESLQISDASLIDLGGDGDGLVEFDFMVVPTSELENLTELGFNLGGGVELFQVGVGYEFSVNNPFSDLAGPDRFEFGDTHTFGPIASIGDTFPIAEVEVFNDTFDLAFEEEQFFIAA